MRGINVELTLSDGSFTRGMLRSGQSLAQFQNHLARTDKNFARVTQTMGGMVVGAKRLEESNRSLLSRFRDISIVAGAVTLAFRALSGSTTGLVGQIVKVNSDMERLRFQMEAMSIAPDPFRDSATSVAYLRDQIRRMPFSLREITTTFTKLRASGTDPMAGSLEAITDGIAAFGGTDEALHRVTLGITQMSGKSVIQMEEMRQQLGETMPNAMRLMARSMGVSVRELTNAIATGRVQAQPALEAFYRELDASFGGSAQRMMHTFSGQVTLVSANLQQLATTQGLKDFVDVTLKGLVEQLNEFLQTPDAERLADGLASIMTTVVTMGGNAVRYLIEFRTEIKNVALALGAGLGIKFAVSSVDALGMALRMATMNMATFKTTMFTASLQLGTFKMMTTTAGLSLAGLNIALRSVFTTFRAFGAVLLATAPWMLALGTAVYGLASAIGLLGSDTDQAYSSLVRYGAESRRQAVEGVEAEKRRIEAQMRSLQSSEDFRRRFGRAADPDFEDSMNALVAEYRAVEASLADILAQSGETEDRAQQERIRRRITTENQANQEERRRVMTDLDARLVAEQDAIAESGETMLEINTRYREAKLTEDLRYAEREIEIIQSIIAEQEAMKAASTDQSPEFFAAAAALEFLQQRLADAMASMIDFRNQKFGITLGADLDDDSGIKAATKALSDLNSEIASMEMELSGANTELERAQIALDRGDYGSIESGGQAFEDLKVKILEAANEADRLAEILGRREAIEVARDEVTDLTGNLAEMMDELSGIDDAYERMQARIARGDFGFISNETPELVELHATLLRMAQAKRDLDIAMAEKAKIEAGTDALREMRNELTDTVSRLAGVEDGVVAMNRAIANGDYGSIEQGGRAVERLHDALREAADAKSYLDRVMESSAQLMDDIDGAIQSSIDRNIELRAEIEGVDIGESDRIAERIKNGYYEGFGEINRVRAAITTVIQTMNIQGIAANTLGDVMRNNTFGEATISQITQTTSAVQELYLTLSSITGMNLGIGSMFGSVMPGGGSPGSLDGYLSRISSAESGGNPNARNSASSATGVYQFIESTWQRMMSTYPQLNLTSDGRTDPAQQDRAIRAFTQEIIAGLSGAGLETTYANMYAGHFLGMGAAPDVLRSSNDQQMSSLVSPGVVSANPFLGSMNVGDFRAWTESKVGTDTLVPGAGAVQTSTVPSYDPAQITSQVDAVMAQLEAQQAEAIARITELTALEADNRVLEGRATVATALNEAQLDAAEMQDQLNGVGENLRELYRTIRSGTLGTDTNVASAAYADIVTAMREADRLQESLQQRTDNIRDATQSLTSIEETRVELAQRLANEQARAADPNYQEQSSQLQTLTRDLDAFVEATRLAYGEGTAQYRDALAMRGQMVNAQSQTDVLAVMNQMRTETRQRAAGLATERQQRRQAYDEQIAEINRVVDQARAAGLQEVEIARWAEEQKAVARNAFRRESSPLADQMSQWGDIMGQLQGASTQWTSSLASGMAGLVMGTGTLKSALDSVLASLSQIASQWILSKVFGMVMPGFGAGPAPVSVGVGVGHTGGIVGVSMPNSRTVSPGTFAGAPKFHGGGIVGGGKSGLNLDPSEVPIIAQKGEGIFTSEQMKHLGGSSETNSFVINAPVSVNGSAGTPAQNQDLADKMARQMESSMRRVVDDQLRKQMRPGNMIGSR